MIKCNVTTCGVITSSAEEKTSKEGEKFISFSMVVPPWYKRFCHKLYPIPGRKARKILPSFSALAKGTKSW